jgi:hypothetical protein
MGYTHYWKIRKPFTNEAWNAFVHDVQHLMQNSDIPLGNGYGDVGSSPIFKDNAILFNGVDDDSCETCYITKECTDFEFCKTRQYPYDSVVVEVLKLARKHNPSIELSSDGGYEVFD